MQTHSGECKCIQMDANAFKWTINSKFYTLNSRRVLASARKKSEIVLSLSLSNAPNRALKVKFRNEASQLNLKLCYLKDLKNGKNERSND